MTLDELISALHKIRQFTYPSEAKINVVGELYIVSEDYFPDPTERTISELENLNVEQTAIGWHFAAENPPNKATCADGRSPAVCAGLTFNQTH